MDTKGMRQTRNEFVRQKSDTVAHLSPFNVVASNVSDLLFICYMTFWLSFPSDELGISKRAKKLFVLSSDKIALITKQIHLCEQHFQSHI